MRLRTDRLGLVVASLAVHVVGCSDSSGETAPYEPPAPAVGSKANPQVAAIPDASSLPVEGSGTYCVVFQTWNSGEYTIDGTGADLSWKLFSDDGFSSQVADCASPSCSAGSLRHSTSYYLELTYTDASPGTDVSIRVTTGIGEGSLEDPMPINRDIAACTDSYLGRVGTGNSYYVITEPGRGDAPSWYGLYGLVDDADVYAYSDADFTTLLDSGTQAGTSAEFLTFDVPTNDTYYLRVDGTKTTQGTTFQWYCD